MTKSLSIRLVAVLVGLVAATALAPLTAAHDTAAVGTGSGAPEQWAYGYEQWSNNSVISSGYSLNYTSFYALQTVTTATNTSNSTVELETNWTWVYTYDYLYCAPNCTVGTTLYNLTLSEWSTTLSFTNTTSAATVYENGTPAAAFGIVNGSYVSASNYSEQYLYVYNGSTLFQGVAFTGSNATWQATFSPALGLVPWNLAVNQTWNSSASVATGAVSDSTYLYAYLVYGYNSLSRGNAYSKYSLTSNETVAGRDLGNTTLSNGQNATSISLAYTGPSYAAYGLLYAPQSATLFGGATQNWSVGVVYGMVPSSPSLYVEHSANPGKYRVVGGTTLWNSKVSVYAVSAPVAPSSGSPVLPTVTSTTSVAQPERVAFAQDAARCLLSTCPTVAPATPSGRGASFPAWAIAAVAVTGAAAILTFIGWRRRPPAGGT